MDSPDIDRYILWSIVRCALIPHIHSCEVFDQVLDLRFHDKSLDQLVVKSGFFEARNMQKLYFELE